MATNHTTSQPSQTSPLDFTADDSRSNISSQPGDEPQLLPTATRPPTLNVRRLQQYQGQDHLSPTSPTSPPGVTGPRAETRDVSGRPSAAHAAISDTVDITNTLSDNRFSQGHTLNDSLSRPTTGGSRSHATSGSRTHVASLRSPNFFQPMSSQRLQAQRGARPSSAMTPGPDRSLESDNNDPQRQTQRDSMGTAPETKAKRSPRGLQTAFFEDEATAPPTSRGSDVTERTDWPPHAQATNTGLINGNMRYEAAQSLDTFHDTDQAQKSTILDTEKAYPRDRLDINRSRSPRSLVSALRRRSEQESAKTNGHEKLSSRDSTSLKKPKAQTNEKKLGRNWEYFEGNTMFFWGGRLETAKDKPIVIGTAAAIILPAILWFIFSAPWLWHNVSPAVPIMFAYIFFITMSSFCHACFTDPGIYPRNLHPFPPVDPSSDPLALGPPTTTWTMVKTGKAQSNAFEIPTKYCKSCNIWRSPRCHHCRVCDSCVDTQDHHCVWLNNCVGRRNYRYFYTFIGAGALLGIYLFASCVGQISYYASRNAMSFSQALGATADNGVAMFLFLYGLMAFAYPLSLWGYHDFLIGRGYTTREYLALNKFLKKDRHRPFDQKSWWRNFVAVIFRPRSPSAMDFKKSYQEGDQRLGERRGFWRKEPIKHKDTSGGQLEMQQFDARPAQSFQGPSTVNGATRSEASRSQA